MLQRIAINLRGRGMDNARTCALGQTQHVERAQKAHLAVAMAFN